MPLGIQRLNAQQSAHPTPHIAFIKPLAGPGAEHARKLLDRVAAICHPVLSKHHLAVMTLEEYEPNREFLGRNFNAGEVIQLVLRRQRGRGSRSNTAAPRSEMSTGVHTVAGVAHRSGPGSESNPVWLPFRSIVMVMLHELAHCIHMHHRAAFWRVRDDYANEMRALWAQGYTGEGLWGRGRALGSVEEVDGPAIGLEEGLPAEVCGGVYQRKRRKRGTKRKREAAGRDSGGEQSKLTYAERQQRRIRRKFGLGGTLLGEDEDARAMLGFSSPQAKGPGKPRVAQSARGRELRAQAALARLAPIPPAGSSSASTAKPVPGQKQLPFVKVEPEVAAVKQEGAEDADGRLETESETDEEYITALSTDAEDAGPDLVKICPDTAAEESDEHTKAERQELQDLYSIPLAPPSPQIKPSDGNERREVQPRSSTSLDARGAHHSERDQCANGAELSCPACSLVNSTRQACCGACGCVLWPEKVPGHWHCPSAACTGSTYINARDYGVCGVCGERREAR